MGIDVATTGVKAVMLKKSADAVSLLAADVFQPPGGDALLELPKAFSARYCALGVSDRQSVIKLLSLPGKVEEAGAYGQIKEHMGLDSGEYRIGYKVISEGHGRAETKLLAAALPEATIANALSMFRTGIPVPCSMELSGLAALTAFLNGPGTQHDKEAVGVVEFGATSTFLAFFNSGTLVLLRKFDIGSDTICDKIQQALGVDADTARGILSDGSFDISQAVNEVLDPFLRQLVISRDFIERRDQCHIPKIYVSGTLQSSAQSMQQFIHVTGVQAEPWDPLAGLTVQAGAVPEHLQGQESRLSAAIGAGLSAFLRD
ncbi:MAG: pilus assembly protein PilM [Kiritimatiellae bacterium]|nr:pilus assembly protein PilM [Kiritimatiellia bacterium]